MEENDWQAKEHVGNKCEMDVTERRRQNSYVMLLGFLHLCIYTWLLYTWCQVIPLLFLIRSRSAGLAERLIQLWNPTRIRQSIVTKCHPPITILFHWAGPGLYNFYEICMQSSITVIFSGNQVPYPPPPYCSTVLALVCKLNGIQWIWFGWQK